MLKRPMILRLAFVIVLLMCFSSVFALGYAYWDQTINTQENTVNIGDWGVPITTPLEFYTFATKSNSTNSDRYFLMNDIDFSGFNWVYNSSTSSVVFRGILDGNGKALRNLTLSYSNYSYSNKYLGIFPIMQGGSVYNVTLENINLVLGSNYLNRSNLRSGLIAGEVSGSTNTISGITIINCGVRGTNDYGVGGLIGTVTSSSAVVNIDNVKATNLKVFSKTSYVGGLIGRIYTSGATVNINDIDIEGEVYSPNNSSYTGGVIGGINYGGKLNVNRAIVEMTSRNTLETNYNYNNYSVKYLGGIIGRNQSSKANIYLTDTYFTGSLYTQTKNNRGYVGTLIGASSTAYNKTRTYYANVTYRASNGSFITSPDTTIRGTMADLAAADIPWWNDFKINFDSANNLWGQDSTGRLYLIRP